VFFLLAIGLTVGGAAAILFTFRLLDPLLFGVTPADPAWLGFAASLQGAVALAASYIPDLRAARLAPMSGLRAE